ncbi:MAG: molecular chaperone TorD family protein [Gammaproteobacteria bacterium]
MAPRSVAGRDVESTAAARCACYAALSALVASPHDLDPRPALRERIGLGSGIEYVDQLDALLDEFASADLDELKREYSGLFEVGDDGPPAPIREDLQTGQRSGTREDIVRFFNFFKYKLSEKYAWAPDHLSVELEFMHFLCYREATAGAGEHGDVLSYQLAQLDFSTRHLVNWVPRFAETVTNSAPNSLYARALAAVAGFVRSDNEWQGSTVVDSLSNDPGADESDANEHGTNSAEKNNSGEESR